MLLQGQPTAPCVVARRHRAPPRSCVVARAAAPAAAQQSEAVQQLKQSIIDLAGPSYGFSLSDEGRSQVEAKVRELEALGLPVKVQQELLTGTRWTTVFTTSTGTSSGKVGPFITDVTQDFPADEPGVYDNVSTLGFVSARLRGVYGVTRDDRIDLEFQRIELRVGPLTLARKEFEPGQMRGYWRMSFCDRDFRVFYTNKGNLFVLKALP